MGCRRSCVPRYGTSSRRLPWESCLTLKVSMALFDHSDVSLRAHVFKHFRPHRHADLAQVRLPEQEHHGARLPDLAADGEGERPVDDPLVIWELQQVELVGQLA